MNVAFPTVLVWMGPAPDWAGGATAPAALSAFLDPLQQALPEWQVRAFVAPWRSWEQLETELAAAQGMPIVVAAPLKQVSVQRFWDLAGEVGRDPASCQLVDPWLGFAPDPWAALAGALESKASDHLALAIRRLVAAAARAANVPARPTPPEGVRLRITTTPATGNKPGLFRSIQAHYEPVPWVHAPDCRAAGGCDLCAAACPVDAISCTPGRVELDAMDCTGCGRCAAVCPTGAITHPTCVAAGLTAAVDTWVGGRGPAVVAYACPSAMTLLGLAAATGPTMPPEVLTLPVPCAVAVPVHVLLGTLEQGAAAVALLTCPSRCRCGVGADELGGAVEWAAQWLARVGADPGAVVRIPAETGSAGQTVAALRRLVESCTRSGAGLVSAPPQQRAFDPPATALGRLLSRYSGRGLLAGSTLPVGRVELKHSGACTLCGLCADACPTTALYCADAEGQRLLLRPGDCTGCGACARICPEQALRVDRSLDLDELRSGVSTLADGELQRCSRCGQATGPAALPAAIRDKLARSAAGLSLSYLDLCPSCRLASQAPAPRQPTCPPG